MQIISLSGVVNRCQQPSAWRQAAPGRCVADPVSGAPPWFEIGSFPSGNLRSGPQQRRGSRETLRPGCFLASQPAPRGELATAACWQGCAGFGGWCCVRVMWWWGGWRRGLEIMPPLEGSPSSWVWRQARDGPAGLGSVRSPGSPSRWGLIVQ